MSTAHTPTPWRAEGSVLMAAPLTELATGEIGSCYETSVEELGFNLPEFPLPAIANAAHIVRCVNAHNELVAALRTAVTIIGRTMTARPPMAHLEAALSEAVAAVKKATL